MNQHAASSVFTNVFLPEKGAYDAVFSLGCNCGCAEYLRKYDLRSSAGPFDWILAPDAQTPFKELLENLRRLPRLEDLRETPDQNGKISNRVFVSGRSGYTFFHDFWKGAALEEQLPAIRAKYARRAERLLDALCGGKKTLLVWYGENGLKLSEKEIREYCVAIRKKYGENTDFLIVQYEPGLTAPSYKRLTDGVNKVAFPLRERKEGNLLWDRERVGEIFACIKCRASHPSRWKERVKTLVVRAASVFIWNRQKRHHFIDVYLNGK